MISNFKVSILNNPAKYNDRINLEITFDCLAALPKDFQFKVTYVVSPGIEALDQELDSFDVGPVPHGSSKFMSEAMPPIVTLIPSELILGVSALLVTCAYDNQEFIRIGYYVSNEYDTEEMRANPSVFPDVLRIVRDISADKPRITRYSINWDNEELAPPGSPSDQPNVGQVSL